MNNIDTTSEEYKKNWGLVKALAVVHFIVSLLCMAYFSLMAVFYSADKGIGAEVVKSYPESLKLFLTASFIFYAAIIPLFFIFTGIEMLRKRMWVRKFLYASSIYWIIIMTVSFISLVAAAEMITSSLFEIDFVEKYGKIIEGFFIFYCLYICVMYAGLPIFTAALLSQKKVSLIFTESDFLSQKLINHNMKSLLPIISSMVFVFGLLLMSPFQWYKVPFFGEYCSGIYKYMIILFFAITFSCSIFLMYVKKFIGWVCGLVVTCFMMIGFSLNFTGSFLEVSDKYISAFPGIFPEVDFKNSALTYYLGKIPDNIIFYIFMIILAGYICFYALSFHEYFNGKIRKNSLG